MATASYSGNGRYFLVLGGFGVGGQRKLTTNTEPWSEWSMGSFVVALDHPFSVWGMVMLGVISGLIELPTFDPSSTMVGKDNASPHLTSAMTVICLVLYNDQ